MTFLKNNFWTLFSLALVLMVAMTSDASAAGMVQGNTVVGAAVTKAGNVFNLSEQSCSLSVVSVWSV